MVNFSIAEEFPRWKFQEKLGSNYTSETYLIKHPERGKCVLKLFSKAMQNNNHIKSFFSKLHTTIKITHTNLAKVYETHTENNRFYFLREYVKGENLENYLNNDVDAITATQIILDISLGIFSGYPFGIIYNNIKPSNIIIDKYGIAKLCDYCIPAVDLGYLSPEQMKQQKTTSKSDVYSLNVIYYEMIYEELLFPDRNPKKILEIQGQYSIPPQLSTCPIQVPSEIYEILNKNLHTDMAKRYTPFHFIKQLNNILKALKAPQRNMIQLKEQQVRDAFISSESLIAISDDEVWDKEEKDIPNTENIAFSADDLQQGVAEVILTAIDKNLFDVDMVLPTQMFSFPKQYEEEVVNYLYSIFMQECWLLKKGEDDKLEIEINLEEAYIYKHSYIFEEILEKAIAEASVGSQSVQTNNVEQQIKESSVVVETISGDHEKIYDTIEINSAEMDIDLKDSKISISHDNHITRIKTQKGSVEIDNSEIRNANDTIDLDCAERIETLNDITFNSTGSFSVAEKDLSRMISKRLMGKKIKIIVDFENRHQTIAWVKFVRKYKLYKGEQFTVDDVCEEKKQTFTIFLDKLKDYEKVREHVARIKQFFEGDYEIFELDRGGMGTVLKLTSRSDNTILSLRPENYWARARFAPYLRRIKNLKNEEVFYAELPKGTEFVVKVGFEGYEESLIREAKILTSLAEDQHICNTIIGSVQQGRLYARDEKEDQEKIGYYLMLEYAPQGNLEQVYKRFPDRKLSPSIAFAIMYGMVQTLQVLKNKGFIHRDVKPQNILLDHQGLPKLSDFGLAITTTQASSILTEDRKRLLRIIDDKFRKISIEREHTEQIYKNLLETQENLDAKDLLLQNKIEILKEAVDKLKEREEERAEELKGKYRPISAEENALKGRFAGSLYYAAPEQFTTDIVLTHECDMYQLGAVMFTMLTGKRPVTGKNTFDIMSKILDPKKPKVSHYIQGGSIVKILSYLISRMMEFEPKERISVEDVRERMYNVLFEHALELRELPHFTPKMRLNERQEERWRKKVEFAQNLHKTCVDIIFSTVFQDRGLPDLSEDLQKITFRCNECEKKIHVYRHMNGKYGQCPQCGMRILIQLQD